MGSKNLKTIAIRGRKTPAVADLRRVKEITRWMMDNLYKDWMTKANHEYGTGGQIHEGIEVLGALPVRNWRDGIFPVWNKIHAGVIKDTIRINMEGCFGCPVRCKKVCKFDGPYQVDPAYGGPEYETLASLGSNCGIDNLKAIIKANELCNAYGLDTISTGGVIAFAMECFERGLINTNDTEGVELKFGDDAAMLRCIELIARCQGFGKQLAEGTAKLAEKIGKEAEESAIHVKRIDLGMHEPRLWPSIGLGFMVNPHGTDHVCNVHLTEEEMTIDNVRKFKVEHCRQLILDCMVMCHFFTEMISATARAEQQTTLAEVVAAVTRWNVGITELEKIVERIFTLARLLNIREGFTFIDDQLPKRFFHLKMINPYTAKPLTLKRWKRLKNIIIILWDGMRRGYHKPEKFKNSTFKM